MAQFPNKSSASGKWSLRQQSRLVNGSNWKNQATNSVLILVVGGGGGGGFDMGGGGGGGGVSSGLMNIQPGSYSLTIGAGGLGNGSGINGNPATHQFTSGSQNGSDSFVVTPYSSLILSKGGGFGGSSYWDYTPGAAGGSGANGGGASGYSNGTAAGGRLGGSPTQPYFGVLDALSFAFSGSTGHPGGYAGPQYYPGGGAGAGGPGTNSPNIPNGGSGILDSITGVNYYWGGGGGGSAYSVSPGGNGGIGGGGGGAVGTTTGGAGLNNGSAGGGGVPNAQTNTPGGNGGANTGGGGGGGSHYTTGSKGGNGGSGVIIIAYLSSDPAISNISAGLTYSVSTVSRPDYRVYTFTAGTGTITF